MKKGTKNNGCEDLGNENVVKGQIGGVYGRKNWDHMTHQVGIFSYTGLTPEQTD